MMGDAQLHKQGGEWPTISGSQVNEGHTSRKSVARLSKQMLHEGGLFVERNDELRVSQHGEGRHRGRDRGGGLGRNGSIRPVSPISSQDMFGPRELQTCGLQRGNGEG